MRLSAAAKTDSRKSSPAPAWPWSSPCWRWPRPRRPRPRAASAEQYGIVYLLLNVARDQQLIEKHGKADGVDISVEWAKLSGGSAVNDALLSGAVDIAGAGVGPLLTIWDRTRGKQNVKGVASLGNFPYYLVTNNPNVKSIADFTERDRIALPAVGVSVQSRVLQLASAKLWATRTTTSWTRSRWRCRIRTPPPPSSPAARRSPATSAIRRSRNRSWPRIPRRASCSIRMTCWAAPARPPCSSPPRNSARTIPRPTRPSSWRSRKPPSSPPPIRKKPPTPTCA